MIVKQRVIWISLVGLLLSSTSLVCLIKFNDIHQGALEWFMILKPNSMITNLWESPDLVINVDLYLFNWTNSKDYKNPEVKPSFVELGPYRFTEKMQKLNVVWNDENSTVSYLRRSRFDFIPEKSAGNPMDLIVTPNLLSVGIHQKAMSWNPVLRTLMLMALNVYGNEPTMRRHAKDWMFDGFDTPLIKMSKMVPTSMVPELKFPYEKIGFGYPRNGSTEIYGHHNVYTGRQDFSKLGQIARWRYDNVSFANPKCQLGGSTGEFQPVPLKKHKPISYFLPDICRELEVDYADTITYEGIEGYVYKGTTRNMANATVNPKEKCHCMENCKQERSGVLNVSTCWYDVPVFASYPHFYKADPFYVEQVEGMKPDKNRHEMTVILEPKTGMILEIKARIMASLLVEPRPESVYRKSRRHFFPLIWADYNVRITPDLLDLLKLVPLSITLGKFLCCLGVLLGLILVLWYPRQILWKKRLMKTIEISGMEARCMSEQTKGCVIEGSPLLDGLQYVPKEPAGRAS